MGTVVIGEVAFLCEVKRIRIVRRSSFLVSNRIFFGQVRSKFRKHSNEAFHLLLLVKFLENSTRTA